MAYLIVISLLLFFIVTVVLALMFCKFAFSLATKLIVVKTCELEDTKEAAAAVNFLLSKFVAQSFLLWCVVQFLLVYFAYDKIEDAMSLFGLLNSFLIVLICNFYLAKIKFNSSYVDAAKINLVNSILLLVIPPVFPGLCYAHYSTSGQLFINSLSEILYGGVPS